MTIWQTISYGYADQRSTYANTEMMSQSLIKSLDGDVLIEKITPLILIRTIEDMIYGPHHISNSYAAKFKIFLQQLFAFAIKESYLDRNPADSLVPIDQVKVPTRLVISSWRQMNLITCLNVLTTTIILIPSSVSCSIKLACAVGKHWP